MINLYSPAPRSPYLEMIPKLGTQQPAWQLRISNHVCRFKPIPSTGTWVNSCQKENSYHLWSCRCHSPLKGDLSVTQLPNSITPTSEDQENRGSIENKGRSVVRSQSTHLLVSGGLCRKGSYRDSDTHLLHHYISLEPLQANRCSGNVLRWAEVIDHKSCLIAASINFIAAESRPP